MTQEQIKQAAKELRKEFEGKYGPGSNLNSKDIAYLIERTYIDGAQSRQPKIDELIEALRGLMIATRGVIAINIKSRNEFLTQYNKANELLKKYEQ